jgi:hypothetical protein
VVVVPDLECSASSRVRRLLLVRPTLAPACSWFALLENQLTAKFFGNGVSTGSSPQSSRSSNSPLTTVVFSVAPCHTPKNVLFSTFREVEVARRVSTRNYRRAVASVLEAYGIAKSSVSRQFVAASIGRCGGPHSGLYALGKTTRICSL